MGRATLLFLLSAALFQNPAFANDKKLTEDDRIEILRGMMAEFATVKSSLPRSPKPLPFESTGTWDKQKWAEAAQKFGPAARVGDQVQITKVSIEGDKILFEINGGMKGKGHWYDHVQAGRVVQAQAPPTRAAAHGPRDQSPLHMRIPPRPPRRHRPCFLVNPAQSRG